MKTIERDNVILDYTLTGKGNITLVLIHGAFIDKNYWQAQVDYFCKNYKVVTVDLAGHGKSGNNRSDWSIESLGEDIVTVINELNLSSVILIGHSLGGDVILEVADRIPEKVIGFAGIDNFKNAGTAMPSHIQKQIEQALLLMQSDFAGVSENFARQSLLTPLTDKLVSERVIKDYKNFNPQIGVALLKSSFLYYDRERELLQKLGVKLYLINVDYFPTNEPVLKLYAHSGYEILLLKGTCHYPMIENPDEFNQLLENVVLKIKLNE
jgi:sigma-B regulation protein RsbQ